MLLRKGFLPVLVLVLTGCGTFGSGGGFYGPSEPSVFGSYLQGRFAAQSFDIPRAEEAFEEVARRTDSLRGNKTAFGYALALGDFPEAVRQAKAIEETGAGRQGLGRSAVPGDVGIGVDLPRLTLASEAMKEGKAQEVLGVLGEPLTSPLGQSLAILLRSAAALQVSGLDEATRMLRIEDDEIFRGLVPLQAALMLDMRGDAKAAEAVYRQAVQAPRAEIAALAYARYLERHGRGDDAARIYSRMVQDAGLMSRAGRMGLTRLGVLEGEPKVFRRRAANMPPVAANPQELFALALENYAWLGFEQALSIQPRDAAMEQQQRAALIVPLGLANLARAVDGERAAAHYLSGLVFGFYKTPAEARDALAEVPPESWLYGYAELEKAQLATDAGDVDGAIAILKQAIEEEKRAEPQWALQLHLLLAEAGRYAEADAYATMAIREAERLDVLPSSLWRYYFARGAARLEAGNRAGGFEDLETALELAPDEPIVLNHLGYSYVERGEQLERAFGMIERALEIQPQNGAIVDSLGWAHFQQGDYEAAITHLERAVALEPADAVITDHLGDAYFMVGRERDARYEWERVLTLDDAGPAMRAEVRRKLRGRFGSGSALAERKAAP